MTTNKDFDVELLHDMMATMDDLKRKLTRLVPDDCINTATLRDKSGDETNAESQPIARSRRSNTATLVYAASTAETPTYLIDELINLFITVAQETSMLPPPSTERGRLARYNLVLVLNNAATILNYGNIQPFLTTCQELVEYRDNIVDLGTGATRVINKLVALGLMCVDGNIPITARWRLSELLREKTMGIASTDVVYSADSSSLVNMNIHNKARAVNARENFREAMTNDGHPAFFRRPTVSSCVPRYRRKKETNTPIKHGDTIVIITVT